MRVIATAEGRLVLQHGGIPDHLDNPHEPFRAMCRILGALDAAMAAHAEEQPAAEWDDEGSAPEDVSRGTSRQGAPSASVATRADARDPTTGQQGSDTGASSSDIPRGTFLRGSSRTVRRADALAWMAERVFEPGDAPALAPDRHEIVVHVEAEVL